MKEKKKRFCENIQLEKKNIVHEKDIFVHVLTGIHVGVAPPKSPVASQLLPRAPQHWSRVG